MNPGELKIEYYKSGGPGGQHKNKRFMAVRITHLATGIVAVAEERRSQALNKQQAMLRLRQKLAERFRKRKPRIPTRAPRAVKEKVLAWKKLRSIKKKQRRERFMEDEGQV